MLFKLCSLYSPKPSGDTSGADGDEPRVKQFDYLAEENFLLVALLSSDDFIDVYYKTGNSVKVSRRSLAEFYDDDSSAVLVKLLPDACAVAVVFANGSVLTIPIKYFLAVSWSRDSKFAQTITFHSATCAETVECVPPVGTTCFTSKISNRVILVFATREGYIVIWDLTAESVSACIHGPDNVSRLDICQKGENTNLVVFCESGEQWSIPIETEGRTIRDTLAHVIPSELRPISPAAIFNDGKCQIFHDQKKNELYLRELASISFASLPIRKFTPKCQPRLVYYNQDLLTVVNENDDIFVSPHFTSNVPVDDVYYPVMVEQHQRVLGFLPSVHSNASQLYEPVVVTEFGIGTMKALKSLEQFAVECTISSGFNATVCRNIASRLSRDAVSLCHDVVRTALCNAPTPSELTLIISMALDLQMDTNHLIAIFNEFDRSDALLPVLLRTCNKNPEDVMYSNALLEAFCCRFQKLPKEDIPNAESDLRSVLLKYNYDANSLSTLLKNKMWSSAIVLLSKDVPKYTLPIATFLLEVPSWHGVGPANVVRFLSLIEWSLLEARVQTLITRMVAYMPNLTSRSQLLVFSRIAELFLNAYPEVAQPMFLIASTRLISSNYSNGYPSQSHCCVGSVGSNNSVVIGSDDRSIIFWGTFAAGALRVQEKSPAVSRLLSNSQSKTTSISPPTSFKLNPVADEFGVIKRIRSIDNGTEHCLVLCDDGTIYSWGTNRYGQCGHGHNKPIPEPMIVDGPWSGEICSVVAGNYHSAILTKSGELWMCGWGFYGQLSNASFNNQFLFIKVDKFSDSPIVSVSCGYAHTLTLTKEGRLYAFGGGAYGQLGVDIATDKPVLDSTSTSAGGFPAERKRYKPQLVPIEEKITAVSSRFFHAVAVSESNKIYVWGSSPQALKLKMYAAKQLRERAARDGKTADAESPSKPRRSISRSHFDVGRAHMEVSELPVNAGGANIVGVSAGLCHSGFVTENGQLYTWGKNLDMQLGFGHKKESLEPTRVSEPTHVKWLEVHCGLNTTLGITTNGCVYVWGRNDLTKLGLPNSKESKPNKITLNSPRGVRVLCLPQDSCLIGTPTVLGGVQASIASGWLPCLDKQELLNRFANTDQLTLNAVSRHFTKHPAVSDVVINAHLLAGDLINAVETLSHFLQEQPMSGVSSTCSGTTSRSTTSTTESPSEINSNFVAEQRKLSVFPPVKATEALELKVFDELLDRAWNLLRIHPLREVQLKTLLYLLFHRFPVYNRLAADLRMCRLIEPYLELKKEQRRLTQLAIKERFTALQNCRIRDQGVLKKQLIGVDRYRFYSTCGHYELTGIQGGVSRAELAAARNRLRKCSRCLQR